MVTLLSAGIADRRSPGLRPRPFLCLPEQPVAFVLAEVTDIGLVGVHGGGAGGAGVVVLGLEIGDAEVVEAPTTNGFASTMGAVCSVQLRESKRICFRMRRQRGRENGE